MRLQLITGYDEREKLSSEIQLLLKIKLQILYVYNSQEMLEFTFYLCNYNHFILMCYTFITEVIFTSQKNVQWAHAMIRYQGLLAILH